VSNGRACFVRALCKACAELVRTWCCDFSFPTLALCRSLFFFLFLLVLLLVLLLVVLLDRRGRLLCLERSGLLRRERAQQLLLKACLRGGEQGGYLGLDGDEIGPHLPSCDRPRPKSLVTHARSPLSPSAPPACLLFYA